ncbi:MAG: DivIVA domain-containing protein [Anaerotignum sp.]|nr:DivIVA domain-containing protein [Anaerotignum sp.]
MITPNDIATKDFKKVAVGYSPEEVDTFLDDIYEDYEKLYKESLKEKTAVVAPVPVADDTDRFKHLEKSIERTLSFAESAAAETKAAAQAEADAILSAAKTQAAEIISAARAKSYELEQDIADLESRYELMKTRVKLLLYAEIELLDKNEILAEKEANAETTK